MALEAGTYISDLVSSNPPQSDSLTQAAGHLRLIKATILATFPNIDGALSASQDEIDDTITTVAAAQFVPAGSIHAFAGATLPTGYLWCDGTSYLRADYAGLFTAISTTWGAADGTHFNVPNFKDRFLIGRATMGATTDAAIIDSLLTSTTLGATYDGEGAIDTITLTTTELPAHTHTVTGTVSGTTGAEAAHTHGVGSLATASGGSHNHTYTKWNGDDDSVATNPSNVDVMENNTQSGDTSTDGAHTHTLSGSTAAGSSHTHSFSGSLSSGSAASSGSGTAFTVAILPPCAVVNYIIKT